MIYLDSAATSLIKPDGVQYAVVNAMLTMASPGRGAHEAAMRAAEKCCDCREALSRLFGVEEPDNVVFTFNATHALNIAIRSIVRPEMRVLVSGYEHNSVTRPLRAAGADIVVADTPLFEPELMLERFERELPGCGAAVFTCVSNVFGYILPFEELARLCRETGRPFVIDASQAAGAMELSLARLGADFIAMPGHKGLLGPQGTGVLLCRGGAEPLLYGGSGSESLRQDMPDFLPDRLEAGTHNVCGIAGLDAGVRYILTQTPARIRAHEREMLDIFADALSGLGELELFYSPDPKKQAGVISLRPKCMGCEELGERLSRAGVAVRTGLHCAPAAHHTAGTLDTGTVRASFSPFTSEREVLEAAGIIRNILKN